MHVIQYPPLLAPPTGVPRSTPSLPLGPYTLVQVAALLLLRYLIASPCLTKAYYKGILYLRVVLGIACLSIS